MTAAEREAEVRRLLDEDDVFFAENCCQIVDKAGRRIPFKLKPEQLRFFGVLRAQRDAGRPERIIVLKGRQVGISTATQATIVRRSTRRANHRALVVAHKSDAAGNLFSMGDLMITYLPPEIRPEVENRQNTRDHKYLKFGRRAREAREAGDIGLNSSIQIDTAKEAEGGRSFTYHALHASELGFWDYPQKITALMNSVPFLLGTIVVIESTANGMNHFKAEWDRAEDPASPYEQFFSPWWLEADYRLAFASPEAREEFVASIGTGKWGEDEFRLQAEFGCTPEQLAWRRQTIVANCEGSLDRWNAEYPAAAEDAFIASGNQVFSLVLVNRRLATARVTDPRAELGLLQVGVTRERLMSGDLIQVPQSSVWVPQSVTGPGLGLDHPFWRVWEHPVREADQQDLPPDERRPDGCYVVAADVAGGDDNTSTDGDWHVIQVIDHRSLRQVAEYRSRVDHDELASQALLAALWWNDAWLAIERTGFGTAVVKDFLWRRYGYWRLYKGTHPDLATDRPRQVLGWSTDRRTKPVLVAGMRELLREENDGIRSLPLVREMITFVGKPNGRMEAEHGHHDDRLMAYMIAQQVARERKWVGRGGSGSVSYVGRRDPRTGY